MTRQFSAEHIKHLSESHKGQKNNLGKHWKIKDKSKMFGHKPPKSAFKKGQTSWNKGKKSPYPSSRKGKKFPEQSGEHHHNWKGGISLAYKVRKIEEQRPRPRACEICGDEGIICYDHSHITGKFRGWVCSPCNCIMGFARDNTEKLDKIIKYLIKNNG